MKTKSNISDFGVNPVLQLDAQNPSKKTRKPIDVYIRTAKQRIKKNKSASGMQQVRSSTAEEVIKKTVSKEQLREVLNKYKEIANTKSEVLFQAK